MKEKLMPLNIQLFAEDTGEGEGSEPVTQTDNNTEGTGAEPVKTIEKTFTQEEVNAMLAKEKKKMPSKEELKAFNEWKESQKTETEKSLEKDKKIETLEKQLAYAESKSVVANAGVDSKFQKFVLSEVSEMEGDFEDNLKDYLKDNPQYLSTQSDSNHNSTGQNQNNGVKKENESKAYLDKKYANNPYYKK